MMYDRRGIPQLEDEPKVDPFKDVKKWAMFLLLVIFILRFLR